MLRTATVGALVACCMASAAARAAEPAARGRARAPADYRLHAAPAPSKPAPVVDGPDGRLRTGFGGSLVGMYPVAGSGVHLSAGGRLFGRAGGSGGLEPEGERLLAIPRGSGVGTGRGGRRRPSPAMLVGVDRPVADGLTLGVDGGAALGGMYRSAGRLGGSHVRDGASSGRVNQMGRVTMSLRF